MYVVVLQYYCCIGFAALEFLDCGAVCFPTEHHAERRMDAMTEQTSLALELLIGYTAVKRKRFRSTETFSASRSLRDAKLDPTRITFFLCAPCAATTLIVALTSRSLQASSQSFSAMGVTLELTTQQEKYVAGDVIQGNVDVIVKAVSTFQDQQIDAAITPSKRSSYRNVFVPLWYTCILCTAVGGKTTCGSILVVL